MVVAGRWSHQVLELLVVQLVGLRSVLPQVRRLVVPLVMLPVKQCALMTTIHIVRWRLLISLRKPELLIPTSSREITLVVVYLATIYVHAKMAR